MFAMVAVDVDRTLDGGGDLGELLGPVGGHAIVAYGKVDVAETVAPGGFDVRAGAVDGHDGRDAEPPEFRERGVPFRGTAGEHVVRNAKYVVEGRRGDGGRKGSLAGAGLGQGMEWEQGNGEPEEDAEGGKRPDKK
jgi:hypothetical protein